MPKVHEAHLAPQVPQPLPPTATRRRVRGVNRVTRVVLVAMGNPAGPVRLDRRASRVIRERQAEEVHLDPEDRRGRLVSIFVSYQDNE